MVATLLALAILGQPSGGLNLGGNEDEATAPAPPPAPAPKRPENQALPPPSLFDPTVTAPVPEGFGPGAGTAFSVSSGGVWLTARHVVEGCGRVVVVVKPGEGVAAEVRIDPPGETAVLITQGGAPALPMAPREGLRRGMLAFHPGFPHGRPGQVASRLIRREILVLRGHHVRRESVLAWAQADDAPGAGGPSPQRSLAGLSGAPALDSRGRVLGVTVAQSPRRGRIYTTTPGSMRATLAHTHITLATGARAAPITMDSYPRVSAALRKALSVAPVACLAG